MLDAPVEYFIDTGKEPVAVVIYRREDFSCVTIKFTWSPQKALQHSYVLPHWQLVGSQFSIAPLHPLWATTHSPCA